MRTTAIIARLTFHEAVRRRILWAALGLGLAFLAVYGVGLYFIFRENLRVPPQVLREMVSFMTMAGLYVVNFLVAVMAVLTSVDTLSGEIASGVMQTIVAKPIRRYQVVLGKWLGFALMLSSYVALMAGGVLAVSYGITRTMPPHVPLALALMILEALVLLGVTLLGGTALSTLANGVLAFGLYGLAFLGGWIEQVGSFLRSETAVDIGIVSSLLMPSESLWKRAAYEMQSALMGELSITPFSVGSVPSPAMILYAVLYAGAMLALAIRAFGKRDV